MNAKGRRWVISLSCFVLVEDTWTNDKAVANERGWDCKYSVREVALRTGGMEGNEVMVKE